MMKQKLLAALVLRISGLAAGATFAAAADAPPQSEGPSHWAGWYAGVDGGYANSDNVWTEQKLVDCWHNHQRIGLLFLWRRWRQFPHHHRLGRVWIQLDRSLGGCFVFFLGYRPHSYGLDRAKFH
jgi:opacity protein-like surface antigen